MNKIHIMVLSLLLLAAPALASTGFFTGVDDLPLMPGMTEKRDETVVFDNPSGRIVETAATSDAPQSQILNFYAQSLPPLGWQRMSSSSYSRADEILTIQIATDGAVHFSISPKG